MAKRRVDAPPRWAFALMLMGTSAACGIFLGKLHVIGISLDDSIRATFFGALALLMLWGTLGARSSQTE